MIPTAHAVCSRSSSSRSRSYVVPRMPFGLSGKGLSMPPLTAEPFADLECPRGSPSEGRPELGLVSEPMTPAAPEMGAAIEDAAPPLARQAPEPYAPSAKLCRRVDDRHDFVAVLPVTAIAPLPIVERHATGIHTGRKHISGLVQRAGVWHVDKRICGRRVYQSTGSADLQEAGRYLARLMGQTRQAQVYGVRPSRTFEQAAAKFVLDNHHKRSRADDVSRLKDLMPFIGGMLLDRPHMGTLQPWIAYKRNQRRIRVHDLKHTLVWRLRAAGVSFEDRQDLLGHRSGRITTHYSAAELSRLIEASERVVEQNGTRPELVVLRGNVGRRPQNSRKQSCRHPCRWGSG